MHHSHHAISDGSKKTVHLPFFLQVVRLIPNLPLVSLVICNIIKTLPPDNSKGHRFVAGAALVLQNREVYANLNIPGAATRVRS